jgi:hypothetical protein
VHLKIFILFAKAPPFFKYFLTVAILEYYNKDALKISVSLLRNSILLLQFHFLNMLNVVFIYKKVKFTLKQATKAQRGSRGIALLFL